ncbi:hypothetical protein AN643_04610 [Candidatus Epulonipiscioides saccharophilum]|nr:hypothetical protein AN643_04610 [Epulopiscium sp. SCG-B10WGA-EpuloB]
MKVACTVWCRGKNGDCLKILPIAIKVLDRGEGGNIINMLIVGEKESIEIETEYLIRTFFSPREIDVIRADKRSIGGLSILPSAFFAFDIDYNYGVLENIMIYGGGNGHGVGMSQEGVRGMVDRGYKYDEILKHYYPGIEIGTIK